MGVTQYRFSTFWYIYTNIGNFIPIMVTIYQYWYNPKKKILNTAFRLPEIILKNSPQWVNMDFGRSFSISLSSGELFQIKNFEILKYTKFGIFILMLVYTVYTKNGLWYQ